MDDATWEGLKAALRASPDNLPILGLLLGAAEARGADGEAASWLEGRDPATVPDATRVQAAAVLRRLGRSDDALAWCPEDGAEALVERARNLLALDRADAAREAYHQAIRANGTVEDPAVAEALKPQGRVGFRDGRPALRLVDGEDAGVDARDAETERPTITFDDVGGLEPIKERIRRRVLRPMQKPGLFARFRRKAGGGVLLYGPPGCGKTLLARATAGESGATFINVKISDVLDMWLGQSEQKLAGIFDHARQHRPSVLFFDEVEALGGKRRYSQSSSHGAVVSQFLTEMDGVDSDNDGVLVLAATNVPWDVDPAFRRPGRFDRVLFVPPPDRPARAAILRIELADRPVADDVDVDVIARRTPGFSGADLTELVGTAADLAIEASLEQGREVPISQALLQEAAEELRPSTREWLTTARNYARYANEGGQYDEVLQFLDAHGARR